MPMRFFASVYQYAEGHVFPVVNAPTPEHIHRCLDPVWTQIEQEMENRRVAPETPRPLAYYACPTLEEAAAYIQYKPPVYHAGEFEGPPPLHYYRVKMPAPTDAAMALFWFSRHHLNHAAVLDAMAEEYWRQRLHQWNYFESLDRTMTILAEVDPPDQYVVMGVMNGYVDDIQQAQLLWP
jgi:hypothetical protein